MTDTQRDLIETAKRQRDDGIAKSSDTSGDEWREYAIAFVRRYLETHPTMHVDDLWNAGLRAPVSPRALGTVIQYAARCGWMEQQYVGRGCVAARPSVRSNMQLKAVWDSLVYVARP